MEDKLFSICGHMRHLRLITSSFMGIGVGKACPENNKSPDIIEGTKAPSAG
jgi:hypothetical protein